MNFLTADVAIVVNASKLPQQLAKAKTAATKTAAAISKSFKKMGQVFKTVFTKMVKVAKWAGLAIAAALTLATKAAMKQEDAIFLLNAALKISGEYTEELSTQFIKFAAEIQQTTIYGDEFVLSLMQQQRSLGVVADKLEESAKMAIGLATATGRGIESMSMYVALAQQGEFTMLRRYIPALRSTTDATKQLAIVTKFAADGFKLAQERAKTTSGVLRQMWNALGDVVEIIGKPLLAPISKAGLAIKKWAKDNEEIISEWAEKWAEKFGTMGLEIRDWLIENKREIEDWAKAWTKGLSLTIDWFIKWRKEIVITVAALATMSIVVTVTTWVANLTLAIKGMTLALAGYFSLATAWPLMFSKLTGGLAATGLGMKAVSAVMKTQATAWGAFIFRLKSMAGLLPIIAKGLVAAGVAMAAWKIAQATKLLWDWHKAASASTEMTEKLEKVLLRISIQRKLEAEGLLGDSPLVKAAKEYAKILQGQPVVYKGFAWADKPMPDRSKSEEIMLFLQKQRNEEFLKEHKIRGDISETASKNYNQMMTALQFEYNMLGEINDVRERAVERSLVQTEIDQMVGVDRIQMMEDYINLYDKLIEKQNSFGHTVQLWMNDAGKAWKNLGDITINAFDTMADSLADALMGMAMDWKAFGRMFIKQLLAMIIKLQMLFVWQLLTRTPGTGAGGQGSSVAVSGSSFTNPMAVFGAPGAADGGVVTQTGFAKIHKGEVISGVNNEMGFGGVTVNNYASDVVDVEVMDEGRVIEISRRASIQAAAGDGPYRRAHKIGG